VKQKRVSREGDCYCVSILYFDTVQYLDTVIYIVYSIWILNSTVSGLGRSALGGVLRVLLLLLVDTLLMLSLSLSCRWLFFGMPYASNAIIKRSGNFANFFSPAQI
jgi:hypothetical protein